MNDDRKGFEGREWCGCYLVVVAVGVAGVPAVVVVRAVVRREAEPLPGVVLHPLRAKLLEQRRAEGF